MGNQGAKLQHESMIGQAFTERPNEISIYDYQIENFMSYSFDGSEIITIHIMNKKKKYTIYCSKINSILQMLKDIYQIYFQDKIFIFQNIYDKYDPFIILSDEDFIHNHKNTIKINSKYFLDKYIDNDEQKFDTEIRRWSEDKMGSQSGLRKSYSMRAKTQKISGQKYQNKKSCTVNDMIEQREELQENLKLQIDINQIIDGDYICFNQIIQLNQKRFLNTKIYNFYKEMHNYQNILDNYLDFASKFEDDSQIEIELKQLKYQSFNKDQETIKEEQSQFFNIKLEKLHKHISQNFIFEINRNSKDVKKQQKAEQTVLKKINSPQFKELIQQEDILNNIIHQFINACVKDIENILQNKYEPQPSNIIYGIKNQQFLLNNTIYIKIHDRDGSSYKQLKSNILLQNQFYNFQFHKDVAVPLQCIIRANEFLFFCISEMPIQWINDNQLKENLKTQLENINRVKFAQSDQEIGSQFYLNDYQDQNFPAHSIVKLSDLGIKYYSNLHRYIRPEFYQKQFCIVHAIMTNTFFSEQLLIQECSYKLQRKINSFCLRDHKQQTQKQQDYFFSNMNDQFQSNYDPSDILEFIENKFLNNVIISILNFLEYLKMVTFEQIKSFFHFNGINLKHIGYVLQRLIRLQQNEQLIYLKDILTTQVLSRTIKNIIIHNIWDYEKMQPVYNQSKDQNQAKIELFLEEKIDYFIEQINQIQNNKEKSFHNICFIKQIQKYFGFPNDHQFKNLNINLQEIKNTVIKLIKSKQVNKFIILKHTQVQFVSKQFISNYIFKQDLQIENKKNVYRNVQKIVQNKSHYKLNEMNQDFQNAFGLDNQFKSNMTLYQD